MMQTNNKTGLHVLYIIMISALAASMVFYVIPLLSPVRPSRNKMGHNVTIETNAEECCITKAEVWEINDWDTYDLINPMDVTTQVESQDGTSVLFNKDYVLRVYFCKDLEEGDLIVLYSRWNTVAGIKNASVYLPNGTWIGEGTVLAQWDWYYLYITENITATNVLDIVIDGGNPSSHVIRIDKVKCQETGGGEEEDWKDPVYGIPIKNYTVIFNYNVSVSGNVDTSNVYLDMEIRQNITDDNAGNATIFMTLLEKATIPVPAVNVSHLFTANTVQMIDHDFAGTDNITIHINVEATAYGKITGTGSWIAITKTFTSLREIKAWWY